MNNIVLFRGRGFAAKFSAPNTFRVRPAAVRLSVPYRRSVNA